MATTLTYVRQKAADNAAGLPFAEQLGVCVNVCAIFCKKIASTIVRI